MDLSVKERKQLLRLRKITGQLYAADTVSRYNRLFVQQHELFRQMLGRENETDFLRALMQDEDAGIAILAAYECHHRRILQAEKLAVADRFQSSHHHVIQESVRSLRKQPLPQAPAPAVSSSAAEKPPEGRVPFLPLPRAFTRAEAETIIRSKLAAPTAERVLQKLRPAIRLWPRPLESALASRFGGLPMVPKGWRWPRGRTSGEPLCFIAQLNCASLAPLLPEAGLPAHGLLSFFAEHDDVNGCMPTGDCALYHFTERDQLRAPRKPHTLFEPLPACGLSAFVTFELPDNSSGDAKTLGLDETESEICWEIAETLRGHEGLPDSAENEISKLFGWPNLIQNDFDFFSDMRNDQLLLQVGWYRTGDDWQGWGPGGTVYFGLSPEDLAARRFKRVALDFQCT